MSRAERDVGRLVLGQQVEDRGFLRYVTREASPASVTLESRPFVSVRVPFKEFTRTLGRRLFAAGLSNRLKKLVGATGIEHVTPPVSPRRCQGSSADCGKHSPSVQLLTHRVANPAPRLLRRLAQTVAWDPLAVGVIVWDPGRSRRARLRLSCRWCAARHSGDCRETDKTSERHGDKTHVSLHPCTVFPGDVFPSPSRPEARRYARLGSDNGSL
jgi:hypothetical protein